MACAVPYQQLETLLAFLKSALRADPVLLQYLDRPDNIVAKTLEHDPLEENERGQPMLFRQELPVLAIWEHSAERIRARRGSHPTGLHKRWGEVVTLRCIYAHKVYHAGSDLTPKAKAARISKLVEWQMREALETHRLDGAEDSFDLLTDGKIRSVQMKGTTRLPANKHLDGFATEIEMIHYSAPYEETTPAALKLIKLELHLDDVVPAVAGPIVYGDVDVS